MLQTNLYNIYKNILLCFSSRGIKINGNDIGDKNFNNEIHNTGYVLIQGYDKLGVDVYIYLVESMATIMSSSLRKLLDKVPTKNGRNQVYLITPLKPKVYSRRAIQPYKKYMDVYTYLHSYFIIDMRKTPLVPVHRVLSIQETNKLLCDTLMCNLTSLPKIMENDVQCVWIGARTGQVVEIKVTSDISGYSVSYRAVIPVDIVTEQKATTDDINQDSQKIEDTKGGNKTKPKSKNKKNMIDSDTEPSSDWEDDATDE